MLCAQDTVQSKWHFVVLSPLLLPAMCTPYRQFQLMTVQSNEHMHKLVTRLAGCSISICIDWMGARARNRLHAIHFVRSRINVDGISVPRYVFVSMFDCGFHYSNRLFVLRCWSFQEIWWVILVCAFISSILIFYTIYSGAFVWCPFVYVAASDRNQCTLM